MRVLILHHFEDGGIRYKPEPYPQHVPDEMAQRFIAEGKAQALDSVKAETPKKRRKA
jgi:hypothetical protein